MPIHKEKFRKPLLFFASVICPGSAHFLLRQYLKACVVFSSYLFHLLLIVTINNHHLLQKPMAIVVLFFALCVHFFYSIFDVLQQSEQASAQQSHNSLRLILAAFCILIWGVLVICSIFVHKIAVPIVYFYPYTFIVFTILYLMTHIKSQQWQVIYLGRWSAIIFLSFIVVSGLRKEIIWQQLHIKTIVIILVILLLLEISVIYLLRRLGVLKIKSFKIDIVSCFTVIILANVFVFVPKYGHLPSEILKSFHNVDRFEYNYDITQFTKRKIDPISLAPSIEHTKLIVNHRNGLLKIEGYNGEYIKVEAVIYDVLDKQFQAEIELNNRVDVTLQDDYIKLNTVLAQYEGQVSKMDIIVYIPFQMNMDELNIDMDYGTVNISNVKQFDDIEISGKHVNVNSIYSSGNVDIKLEQGNSYLHGQTGVVNVSTTSGHIMLHNTLREIKAETLNGNILIMSKMMSESISAHAGIGSVQISIPPIIAYNLRAETSFGEIIINDIEHDNPISRTTSITKKLISIYADQNIVIN